MTSLSFVIMSWTSLCCFSVWVGAGCITKSIKSVADSGCAQEECKGVHRNTAGNPPMIFCCCNTTSCNHQYKISPEKAVSSMPYPTNNKPSSEDTWMMYLLGCVGVVSIISILGLSWCLIAQGRTHRLGCAFCKICI